MTPEIYAQITQDLTKMLHNFIVAPESRDYSNPMSFYWEICTYAKEHKIDIEIIINISNEVLANELDATQMFRTLLANRCRNYGLVLNANNFIASELDVLIEYKKRNFTISGREPSIMSLPNQSQHQETQPIKLLPLDKKTTDQKIEALKSIVDKYRPRPYKRKTNS